jgi:protein TonB
MSNVSIYEKKWIDLVFEGKNQKYGAYQLRQENERTTLLALFSGLLLIAALSGIFMLSSFINKPVIVDTPPVIDKPVIVVKYKTPPKAPVEVPKTVTPLPQAPKTPTPFAPLVVVKPIDVTEPAPTNNNITLNTPTGPTSPTGTATTPAVIPTGPATIPVDTNAVTNAANLDYLPEFPGGIIKFREYIADNFEKPELENATTVKVLMAFVIEKDGSMTDIKVLRNPGYGLDAEAIRVLKSLKTKWKPGLKDGQKMRTQYTLPITVQMN